MQISRTALSCCLLHLRYRRYLLSEEHQPQILVNYDDTMTPLLVDDRVFASCVLSASPRCWSWAPAIQKKHNTKEIL